MKEAGDRRILLRLYGGDTPLFRFLPQAACCIALKHRLAFIHESQSSYERLDTMSEGHLSSLLPSSLNSEYDARCIDAIFVCLFLVICPEVVPFNQVFAHNAGLFPAGIAIGFLELICRGVVVSLPCYKCG